MNFIKTLKLKSKLVFVFIIIIIGLIIIGLMGGLNLNLMKKNLDSLYFGSLVPVVELNRILQTYHSKLNIVMYKAKNSQMDKDKVKSQIKSAIDIIEKEWKNYESHFKRDDELKYIQYTATEIKNVNRYFLDTVNLDKNIVQDISLESIERQITHIDKVIKKLIDYEVEVAKYDRKNFLKLYDSILFQVGSILVMVIFGIVVISYYVFKSIQNDQTALELTTKKLKRANKRLENASYTDSLTGLYNRRYFNIVYDRELKRAKRTNSYIAFMMLDIDYFKQYNDTYGHIEGDFALKSVAKVLQDTLKRPGDFVFRLGGEEFGILLTDTSESNCKLMANEVCDLIRAREIRHESSKVNQFVTISIGVAGCEADESLNEDALITRADEMLYEAKESGRDRYCMSTYVSKASIKEINQEDNI
ncbi:MAG: diguanylate cyclase [Sulfurimonas sp. RIFOXYD12_FULL_33_39]|uniref:diguanylate cyclase domain-containing protein n=1 Tax=unclassified Sulfurimonas TaxID=2623549 RepID=UPI0008B8A745|nr:MULTISPECIES: diguanylate cyclase [unclassified Sulfurimonas]OHE10226.1 MAG: diguanylate cyclase [Sulfurimonas sp. RIFOXYD12_FULL_33_39]OHE14553.1 MAG: diguanylate cyclase [Sulfurimonas sp. RIFOXYD2_FULL_34_21]